MQIKYIHDFDLFKTIANSVKDLQADQVPGAKTHETTKEGNSKMKMRQTTMPKHDRPNRICIMFYISTRREQC